jgi:hypothetical protein
VNLSDCWSTSPPERKRQVNCVAKYLKSKGFLEPDYPEYNDDDYIEHCTNFIEEDQKEYYQRTAELMMNFEFYSQEAKKCFFELLNFFNFQN